MNYKVFVIGIELNSINAKKAFEAFLSSTGMWNRISDGFYIVKPSSSIPSSLELKNRIPLVCYQDGQVFVMRTSIDAAWNTRAEISGWLSSNL